MHEPRHLGRLRRALVGSTVCVAAVLGILQSPATSLAAPSVGPTVNVSRNGGNQGEAAVAIDPTNPQRMFVSGTTGLYRYSADGGATWKTPTTTFANDAGDTNLSWDANGNLFLIFLDTGVFATPKAGTVRVQLSTDGGNTFTQLTTLGSGNIDQPSVTTGHGEVWVTWRGGDGKINASGAAVTGLGSANVGSFSVPQKAGSGNFGDIAIGPTGAVMVSYQRGNAPAQIYVATDSDGLGAGGFGAEVKVTDSNVGDFYSIPPQSTRTVDAESNLAWDRSGVAPRGVGNGRVYLVYTDTPAAASKDTNIFVRHSDDLGATWSTPVRANDDAGSNSQFLPAIALDQTTGKLAVTWYDARNDTGTGGAGDTNNGSPNDDAQYWGTTSDDGNAFAANFQISAGTSNAADAASGIDYGDYSKVAYQSGVIAPAWADNSNSTGDNPAGTLKQFDTYTASVVVTPRATALTYTGPSGADFNDSVTLTAALKSTSTNTGLNGQKVTFTLGSQSCFGLTDVSGNASCALTPSQAVGPYSLAVAYAGAGPYAPSAVSASFAIIPEESALTYTGATTGDYNDAATVSASLVDPDGGAPIAGKPVTFTLGVGDTCTANTNGAGVASCPITPTQHPGSATLTAGFSDPNYKPSNASVSFAIKQEESSLTYTGPTSADYHDAFTATASLVDPDGGAPIANKPVTFTLGVGDTCTAKTNGAGVASCPITPTQAAGGYTIVARFGPDADYLSSSDAKPFAITHEETTLTYDGPSHIANGFPATLRGTLLEDGTTAPVPAGQNVTFRLGSGPSEQSCTGPADAAGHAQCTISNVNQPDSPTFTVHVSDAFAGDAYYLASNGSATVKLLYYTGRAYAAAAAPPPVNKATSDTGDITTAQATDTKRSVLSASGPFVSLGVLSSELTTGGGSSRARASFADLAVGVFGLPVIAAHGVAATSTSACSGAAGATTIGYLKVGSRVLIDTTGHPAPNTTIKLGLFKVILNEQLPVAGADQGLTVNAIHVVGPAGVSVVISSARSDIHNCP